MTQVIKSLNGYELRDETKLPLAGGIITGDLSVDGNTTLNGASYVNAHMRFSTTSDIHGTLSDGTDILVFEPVAESGNTTIGYGQWSHSLGNTNIYGNGISLKSKMGVSSDMPVQTHVMGLGCSTELTLSTSHTKVTMGTDYGSTTNLLTASNGGIKCAVAGKVLVSAQAYFLNIGASQAMSACIYRNSSSTAPIWGVSDTAGSDITMHISPKIITVDAGDIIYLYVRNYSSATGTIPANNNTLLCVQYISAD